jgi:hypothetical protein
VLRTGSQVGTERVEASGSQGATSAAYPLRYASEEQRSEPGCIGARMQHDLRHETLAAMRGWLAPESSSGAGRGCGAHGMAR